MERVSSNLIKGLEGIPRLPKHSLEIPKQSWLDKTKGNIGTIAGKVGQEAKWFGQDLIGNIGDAAKAGGIGVGGMVDAGKGIVSGILGGLGVNKVDNQQTGDKVLSTVSSLPLELIPGVGTGLKIATNVLDVASQHITTDSWKHNTDLDMDVQGYDLAFNENAGKSYSKLFGRSARKRANELTSHLDGQNLNKYRASEKSRRDKLGVSNTSDMYNTRNFQNLHGGTNLGLIAARLGTKIPPVNFRNIADRAVQNVKKKKSSEVGEEKKPIKPDRTEKIKKAYEDAKHGKYKEGGLLTKEDKEEVIEEVVEEKKNVIPEGAFHSRLNKISEDVAEHVTRKGIPVITKDGDKIIQHAEVERNEIIFHKEATDTIETLWKKYEEAETDKLKDEIAIECGKYIAEQILVNTDDRTGIIETIEYA